MSYTSPTDDVDVDVDIPDVPQSVDVEHHDEEHANLTSQFHEKRQKISPELSTAIKTRRAAVKKESIS